jgi:polyferredoxin
MKTRQKVRRALIFTSFALLPITLYYFSPVLSLSGTALGIVTGSLLVFAALFVSSLFVGRLFCGWACPVGGLQEAVALARGRPVNRRRVGWIKWVIWAPWIAGVVFLAIRAGGFSRVDFFYQTWHGISVGELPGLIAFVAVSLLFLVLSLAVGRRAGCHVICWMAPFMIGGRKARNVLAWPSLGLAARTPACTACGSCTKACPMSIDVQAMVKASEMESSDCILCGSCVDGCPGKVIRYSFAGRRKS